MPNGPVNLLQTVMNLSDDEQATLFKLITENPVLFRKILPGNELLEQMLAEHPTWQHPLIDNIKSWKNQN